MKKIIENKKILYIFVAIVILIGITSIFVLRLNFSLMYSEHTKIEAYLGKEYKLQDVKEIAKEVFGKQEILYQEIETFHDAIAISVRDADEEQINTLETKLKEKYEIENDTQIIQTSTIHHLRGRDILKPYIIPTIISTIIVLIYVGIRYMKLGVFKTIFTLLVKLIVSEAMLLSFIAIARIPIGAYIMGIAMLLYIAVIIYTVIKYENRIEEVDIKNNNK